MNKSLVPPVNSITLNELKARYILHDGHILNDVEVTDLLVMMAIEAKDLKRDADFLMFCEYIAPLLPVALDSKLPDLLSTSFDGAITTHMINISYLVRQHRGIPCRPLKHYKEWGNV